jgi:predicted nucleic acid-binding Zn ribbon protein
MARDPKPIGDILSELMARRGFARVKAAAAFEDAWRQAAGEMAAEYTRVGNLRRGKLEVTVANSALVQELSFQKTALLATLRKLVPDAAIRDVRFRVGPLE